MDNYIYQRIPTEERENITSWTILRRQVFICSGTWIPAFATGLSIGSSTVIIAQLKRDNSTNYLTPEMDSWISLTLFVVAAIWSVVLAVLGHIFGRKKTFQFVCTCMTFGFIVMSFSSTPIHLIMSNVLIGSGLGSIMTVFSYVFTEYSSNKYRGFILTVKSASVFWGIWVANAIGTFFSWKYIPIVAICCLIFTSTSYSWPESPLWLASHGRFEECAASNRWLKGTNEDTEKELERLINTEREKVRKRTISNIRASLMRHIIYFFDTISKKSFRKNLAVATLVTLPYTFSGKFACAIYAIELLTKVTNNISEAYTIMLILDGITVLGMYCGCFVARYVRRRVLFLTSITLTALFLFSLSLYFYLTHIKALEENFYMSVFLLTGFSLSISCGPLILSYSLYGELVPIDSRTVFTALGALLNFSIVLVYMKVSRTMLDLIPLYVTFLTFGISTTILSIVMFFILPETKDKSLSEIEEYFENSKVLNST